LRPFLLPGLTPWHDAPQATRFIKEQAMREYVWLECTSCGDRNYRVQKETRGAERLDLKKYCKRERKHISHKESRKK
jgi:large subunit ribosomal protein L33